MSTVADILVLSRDVMREFDLQFLDDPSIIRQLNVEEPAVLDKIVQIGNEAFPLPEDTAATVDVSTYAVSYVVAADPDPLFWRLRKARLVYTANNSPRVIEVVPPNFAYQVPRVHPSAFFKADSFLPMDGVKPGGTAVDRLYGWTGAASVVVDYIPRPAAKTADTDTLSIPDDALLYTAYRIAKMLATRGKVEDATYQRIMDREAERWEELAAAVGTVPGTSLH